MKLDDLKLWPHQRGAIEMSEKYFASNPSRSALIHLPTGTGKTGIMAAISSRRSTLKPTLVVCPSAALAEQLQNDLQSRFWDKIHAPKRWVPENVERLLPSKVMDICKTINRRGDNRVVVVTTVQSLQQIYASDSYAELRGRFGTILFDEGHREPAPLWANAVRNLDSPTVLFSATPFRNDLKLFDVDDRFIHFLSFQKASFDNLIRDVEIQESDIPSGFDNFAKYVVSARDDAIKSKRFDQNAKVIVRAGTEQQVDDLFSAFRRVLKGRSDGVLAIHNNFDEDGPSGMQQRGSVPVLYARHEKFLIHQHMLTEGVDDPNCNMLALFEAFGNERQLIQQVGRLIRHPSPGNKVQKALVIARKGDDVERMWERFLSYDQACIDNGGKPPIRNDSTVLDNLISALPCIDYIDGKFRTKIDLDGDIEEDIRFPQSVVIYEVSNKFNLDKFRDDVTELLNQEDRFQKRVIISKDKSCTTHITLRLKQSPFLNDSLFQSPSLEVTAYVQHGNLLFVYDSAGLWCDEIDEVSRRYRPEKLRALLPSGSHTVVTALTTKNTDIGPYSLRSRSMSARSLLRSGVFMGDQAYVVTSATGRSRKAHRVLNFVRSRVRESQGIYVTMSEFFEWTSNIYCELNSRTSGSAVFNRYAAPIEVPNHTDPRNILVDVESFIGEFVNETNTKVTFNLESACSDVSAKPGGPSGYPFCFSIETNSGSNEIWIKWDSKKEKYWIKSHDLSSLKLRGNDKISLSHRINQQQPFRIILQGRSEVYAYGRFYDSNLNLNQSNGPASIVLNLIQPVPDLAATISEKGGLNAPNRTWPNRSLFGFIDRALDPARHARPLGAPFAELVCDDLGQEVADFIGLDGGSQPRVAFVVAKWKGNPAGVSASALYDACSQAVKNLAYLKIDNQALPGRANKWDNDWSLKGGIVPRMRRGTNSANFRANFKKIRGNPKSSREIWLVLGGGVLSKMALEDGLRQNIPDAHVLQTYHLLLSTYAACQSIGADLRIFSSP